MLLMLLLLLMMMMMMMMMVVVTILNDNMAAAADSREQPANRDYEVMHQFVRTLKQRVIDFRNRNGIVCHSFYLGPNTVLQHFILKKVWRSRNGVGHINVVKYSPGIDDQL